MSEIISSLFVNRVLAVPSSKCQTGRSWRLRYKTSRNLLTATKRKKLEKKTDVEEQPESSFNGFIHGRNVVYTVFKSSEGSGGRPSLPEEQLSLATAGRLRRDCIYIELGHQLDRVLFVQASQTDQQTAVWRLWFKGKSSDSYKSQIDTPASVRGLSSWHTLVQIKTPFVSVILTPAGDSTCALSHPLPSYWLHFTLRTTGVTPFWLV